MNFLKGQKVKQTNDSDPKSFDVLCVEKGELKTTAKLLVSLLHGKIVVTDDWVFITSSFASYCKKRINDRLGRTLSKGKRLTRL